MSESITSDPAVDDSDNEYRSVEPWAVGGLLAGIASASALLGGLGMLLAAGAILVNVLALVRIRRDPTRTGKIAAALGLTLSVVFLVMPVAQYWTAYALLSRQARPIADQWFEELRKDRPERAMRLTFLPDLRPPLDDAIWLYFRHDDDARTLLMKSVRDPLVRTLLALGDRAEVRFLETRSAVSDGALGGVHYVYTVTYTDEDGKKKTFLVSVLLERKPPSKPGLNPWRVKAYFAGREPPPRQ